MNYKPKLASEPRIKPFYIKNICPKCSSHLVLAYTLINPEANEQEIFYDEWACSSCPERTCYLDWPDESHKDIELSLNIFGVKFDSNCN